MSHVKWARDLAQRVKHVQSAAADDRPDARADMVRRTLQAEKQKAGPEWPARRIVLRRQFALGLERTEDEAPAAPPSAPPPPATVESLIEQLSKLCPTPDARRVAAEKLKKAGFAVYVEGVAPLPPPQPGPVLPTPGDCWSPELREFFRQPKLPVYPAQIATLLAESLRGIKELCGSAGAVQGFYEQVKDPRGAVSRDPFGWNELQTAAQRYLDGSQKSDAFRAEMKKVSDHLKRFHFVPQVVQRALCGEISRLVAPEVIEHEVKLGMMDRESHAWWVRFRKIWEQQGFDKPTPESRFWGTKMATAVLGELNGGAN